MIDKRNQSILTEIPKPREYKLLTDSMGLVTFSYEFRTITLQAELNRDHVLVLIIVIEEDK